MTEILKEGVTYIFESLTGHKEDDDWIKNSFLDWEPNTFKVFKALSNSEKIAIDIGAWIGFTPIWLCKNFKHVVCIDADKESIKSLEINLKASGCENYNIINKAIYSENKTIIFGPNVFRDNAKLNDSTSQIKNTSNSNFDYEIKTVTVNDILKDLDVSNIGLIKVDIEGGEENIFSDLLTVAKDYKIPLYISFHLGWWNDKNFSRFSQQLSEFKCYKNGLEFENNPIDFIKNNPFESLMFEY